MEIDINDFFNNILKINIELHSFCNLKCPFCLNRFRDSSNKYIKMDNLIKNKLIDIISKCKNVELICLSGHNQPVLDIDNVEEINLLIKSIKKINENIKIKICSNSSYLDKIDIINKLNFDILFLTKYSKNDIDILNKKYDYVFFNKKDQTFLLKINNKYILYKDFSCFENKNNLFNSNKLNNMGGKFKFLKKQYNENINCDRKEIFIDYTGNVNLCCNSHSEINTNNILFNINNIPKKIYINYNNDWCKYCDSVKNYISINNILKDYVCITK